MRKCFLGSDVVIEQGFREEQEWVRSRRERAGKKEKGGGGRVGREGEGREPEQYEQWRSRERPQVPCPAEFQGTREDRNCRQT